MFQGNKPPRRERTRKDRILRRKVGIVIVGLFLAVGLAVGVVIVCKMLASGNISASDPFQR
jgi:hypothetical protein